MSFPTITAICVDCHQPYQVREYYYKRKSAPAIRCKNCQAIRNVETNKNWHKENKEHVDVLKKESAIRRGVVPIESIWDDEEELWRVTREPGVEPNICFSEDAQFPLSQLEFMAEYGTLANRSMISVVNHRREYRIVVDNQLLPCTAGGAIKKK